MDTQIALGQMICIAVDQQLDMYLSSTTVRFPGAAEDKQLSLPLHAKRSILHKPKPHANAVWIRGLLGELDIHEKTLEEGYPKTISLPTTIFADNQGEVKLIENPEYHWKTKY